MAWLDWTFWALAAGLGAGGVVLLGWALVWDRARGRRRCPGCWYDMSGVPERGPGAAGGKEGAGAGGSGPEACTTGEEGEGSAGEWVCPECGRGARGQRRLLRTRRRWGWAAAAVGVWALAWLSFRGPDVVRYGWPGLVPTRGLILVLPLVGDGADAVFERLEGELRGGALTAGQSVLLAKVCVGLIEAKSGTAPEESEDARIGFAFRGQPWPSWPPGAESWTEWRALDLLDEYADAAAPDLDRMLRRGDEVTRKNVLEGMTALKRPVEPLKPAVADRLRRDPSPGVVIRAAYVLRTWGDSPDMERILAHRILNDPDPAIRRVAIAAAAHSASSAARLRPVLDRVLHEDPDPWVALAALSPPDVDQAWMMPGRRRQSDGVNLLAWHHPDPERILLSLLQAELDEVPRERAVRWLGQVNVDPGVVAPRILGILRDDPSPRVRAQAVQSLAFVAGGGGPEFLEGMEAALGDPDADVRLSGAMALTRFGATPGFAGRFAHLLADPDLRVRRESAGALAAAGVRDPEALDGMLRLVLEDESTAVRFAAVYALDRLAGDADGAVERLIRALAVRDPMLRCEVILSLGGLGPRASASAPLLEELLETEREPSLRTAAGEALGLIVRDGP